MNQQTDNHITPISHFLIQKSRRISAQICDMIGSAIDGKHILILTAGDDTLARMLAEKAAFVTVAVLSADARTYEIRQPVPANLRYLQTAPDALPITDGALDAVVAVNLLYSVPDPAQTMQEFARILKPDGVLIAPCCIHSDQTVNQNLVSLLLRRTVAYRTKQKWTKDSYIAFLHENGWHIRKGRMIHAAYPVAYAECIRKRSCQ
ncbi:MAG TPA: hypothetical protein DCG49_03975 [Ruminococcus sp.]|nr:hypothetical protein [Ruminococcus sp.]